MPVYVMWCYFLLAENSFMVPNYNLEIFLFSSFQMTVTTFINLFQEETEAKLKFLHFSFRNFISVSWIFLIDYWDKFYHLVSMYQSLFSSSFAIYGFIYFLIGFALKVTCFHFVHFYHICYIFNGCHQIYFLLLNYYLIDRWGSWL